MRNLENPITTDTTEAEEAINNRELDHHLVEIREMTLAKYEAELAYTISSDESESHLTKDADGVWRQETRY